MGNEAGPELKVDVVDGAPADEQPAGIDAAEEFDVELPPEFSSDAPPALGTAQFAAPAPARVALPSEPEFDSDIDRATVPELEPPTLGTTDAGAQEDAEYQAPEAPRPRSLVPRPEGYRNTPRTSSPPPKPAAGARLLGRSDRPRDGSQVPDTEPAHPEPASAALPPVAPRGSDPPRAARAAGVAVMPMRMIEVRGDSNPAPPQPELFGETPSLPPVSLRPPGPQVASMSEPPPLPGALPPPRVPSAPPGTFAPPAVPRIDGASAPAPRFEPPLPSSPRLEPPLPSSPRFEPPLPPAPQTRRVEPPLPSAPTWPDGPPSTPTSGRSQPGEPPPLPGSLVSRPAPRPSRPGRTPSGEPPPLPRQGTDESVAASDPAPTLRVSRPTPGLEPPRLPSSEAVADGSEEIELESIPPPDVEVTVSEPSSPSEAPLDLEAALVEAPAEARVSYPGRGGERPAPPELRPRSLPPGDGDGARSSLPGNTPDEEGEFTSRQRPRPPAPPARARGTEAEESSSEPGKDAQVSEPPSDQRPPPPRRRLPPTPPPRTGFTGALEEDPSKRRHWWEEIFSDDYLRAEFELTESQFLAEVDFIQESLKVEKGGVVLDLACGNGRHAIELARRGLTSVGYDLSLSQLARAGERAQRVGAKVSFLHGDMREMAFEPSFDGIYCWNASFGYFEEEKNQAVLRNIFRALKPGGNFLLDIPNRDFVVAQQPSQNWFEGDGCVCMDDMQVDFITSRLVVKRTIMLDDGRNRECVYSIRLYGLHELGRMLHDAGFRVAEVSGHIATRGVFMGGTSPRLLLIVTKP